MIQAGSRLGETGRYSTGSEYERIVSIDVKVNAGCRAIVNINGTNAAARKLTYDVLVTDNLVSNIRDQEHQRGRLIRSWRRAGIRHQPHSHRRRPAAVHKAQGGPWRLSRESCGLQRVPLNGNANSTKDTGCQIERGMEQAVVLLISTLRGQQDGEFR